MARSAETMRNHQGLVLFERGFRPFFPAAGFYAALAMTLWLGQLVLGWETGGFLAGRDLHVHEMLFGYMGAVLAGFLLTAIPNWTGQLPVAGRPLMALVLLWLSGRVMMLTPGWGPEVAMLVDGAFLVTLAAIAWREVLAGGNTRNLPVCILVSLFALANLAFHALSLGNNDTGWAERLGLGTIALLLPLIGGRITPGFTRNWMAKHNITPHPAPFSRFDSSLLMLTAAGLALWIVLPDEQVTGLVFFALATGHALRLARWRGWASLWEPLVAILHLGYAWLPVWFALAGLVIVWPELIDGPAATHALTAGAIGTMTIAVMSRAILGHSGRPLHAGRLTVAIYALIVSGALLRVAAPLLPLDGTMAIFLSGALWAAGFALFAATYARYCLKKCQA